MTCATRFNGHLATLPRLRAIPSGTAHRSPTESDRETKANILGDEVQQADPGVAHLYRNPSTSPARNVWL